MTNPVLIGEAHLEKQRFFQRNVRVWVHEKAESTTLRIDSGSRVASLTMPIESVFMLRDLLQEALNDASKRTVGDINVQYSGASTDQWRYRLKRTGRHVGVSQRRSSSGGNHTTVSRLSVEAAAATAALLDGFLADPSSAEILHRAYQKPRRAHVELTR